MTKSTITRERAQQIFLGNGPEPSASEERELARMALAAMDGEPVAWLLTDLEFGHSVATRAGYTLNWYRSKGWDITPLYRHAQPASVAPVCTCPSGDGSLRWPCPVHPGNSPVIPDGWTGNDKANAALMMLDRIETAYPVDDDRIDGIKRIVRELAAAPHDTPALNSVQSVDSVADRWIPVSERMPENDGAYLCWDNRYVTTYAFIFGAWQANQFIAKNITHWMPLPAVPQEVR